MGLGWDKGFTTTGTCDLYNDKAVRASRALTILWQFKVIPRRELLKVLVENGFTPIAADMLPRNSTKLNTTTLHSLEDICSLCQQQQSLENAAQISEKSNSGAEGGLIFHNFQQNNTRGASLSHLLEKKKIALILSDEHHGLSANSLLDNVIKVSIPMDPRVESLNVAAAGSIIMSQLSAKFPFLSLKKST
ncbi:hypothetical protein BDF20DRAFT_892327 [Mycotypha africana]|uniref:uncharacterized protein n=1 Tax=Mycotypha africana TaxID=64632 RepID=UPI00230185A4|nr:uncharacterized protein BDF20DRAFT_892327 [Mycotypha africana]KAI8968931.1 hypothetical protein BDF20DRAFT_892327 [Mycotypha africana]